jgi:hypothetical protein
LIYEIQELGDGTASQGGGAAKGLMTTRLASHLFQESLEERAVIHGMGHVIVFVDGGVYHGDTLHATVRWGQV